MQSEESDERLVITRNFFSNTSWTFTYLLVPLPHPPTFLMLSRRLGYSSYRPKTAFPFSFKASSVSFASKSSLSQQRQRQCYYTHGSSSKNAGLIDHSGGLKNRARLQAFFGETLKNNFNGNYRVVFYTHRRRYVTKKASTSKKEATPTKNSKSTLKTEVKSRRTKEKKTPEKLVTESVESKADDTKHDLNKSDTKSDDSTNTVADVKETSIPPSPVGKSTSNEVENIAEEKSDATNEGDANSNHQIKSSAKVDSVLENNNIDSNPQNYSAKNNSNHKEFICEANGSKSSTMDHPTTKTEISIDDTTKGSQLSIGSTQNSSIKNESNNDNIAGEHELTSIDDSSENNVSSKVFPSAETKPSEIINIDTKKIESNQDSVGNRIYLNESQLAEIMGQFRQLNEHFRQLNENLASYFSLYIDVIHTRSQAMLDVTKVEISKRNKSIASSASSTSRQEINEDLDISKFKEFYEEINATEGTLKKSEIMLDHPEFLDILTRILNNKTVFYVKSVTLKKFIDKFEPDELDIMIKNAPEYFTIYSLFDALSTKQITGNTSRFAIERYIREKCNSPDLREFFSKILDKKLNISIASKTMNKIFGIDIIPLFSVALGQELPESDFGKLFPESQESSTEWFVSRKYDGVRCIAQYDPHSKNVRMSSRLGNPFTTLKVLEERIKSLINERKGIISKDPIWENGLVLDGEICVFDEEGKDREKFLSALEVRKVNGHQMRNFQYLVFDCLTEQEFKEKRGTRNYQERLLFLKKLLSDDKKEDSDMIDIIEQNVVKKQDLEKWWKNAKAKNWEGLMLRKNAGYQGKRSSDLLKIKGRKDAEYTVLDAEIGPMKIDGVEYKDILRNVIIEHRHGDKINKVHVGSGLTKEDRLKYRTPESIIGKEVTVEYTDESKTQKKNGEGESETVTSLRFPRVKAIYEKKRDV
ncbi:13376_t:CDS:2 [Ambispora gerdemannii]|uniref:13376_t:CDS:1 n=1 Tax=Ambispora gerdemannii TaxID=144530 RepID=A0A9N9GE13_9GLOM|nr:13376_t:CDS:2 [Ambispora gerdemannii]